MTALGIFLFAVGVAVLCSASWREEAMQTAGVHEDFSEQAHYAAVGGYVLAFLGVFIGILAALS